MSRCILEGLIGPVDGVNTVFRTPHSFIANTTEVFLDGQALKSSNDDGWTEAPPTRIVMKIPPQIGSILQALYSVG